MAKINVTITPQPPVEVSVTPVIQQATVSQQPQSIGVIPGITVVDGQTYTDEQAQDAVAAVIDGSGTAIRNSSLANITSITLSARNGTSNVFKAGSVFNLKKASKWST